MPQAGVHPEMGAVQWETFPTGNNPDDQVSDTIALMRRFVQEDSKAPEVREDAFKALEAANGDVLEGVFRQAKKALRFQKDVDVLRSIRPGEDDVECLVRPIDVALLNRRGEVVPGDCDDFSMYCAALLTALGYDAAFRTVAADESAPNYFSHVYAVAILPDGTEVPLDASHGSYVGWEAPNQFGRVETWPVQTSGFGKILLILGLGYLAKKLYDRSR